MHIQNQATSVDYPNPFFYICFFIGSVVNDDGLKVASTQLLDLMECSDLPFGQAERVVNRADSGYSSPKYIHPLVSKCNNLNLI